MSLNQRILFIFLSFQSLLFWGCSNSFPENDSMLMALGAAAASVQSELPDASRFIGGYVTGLTSGELVLQNNGSDDLTLTGDGVFTFQSKLNPGDAYSVTILSSPADFTCSITNGSGIVDPVNPVDVSDISASCVSNLFSLGGTVSGLNGLLFLQNNGGDDLVLSADGVFTFPTLLQNATAYGVTIFAQPDGQTCSVTGGDNGSGGGTVSSVNVTSLLVSCSNNIYSLGGTVVGLDGTVVLQNNGGDDLTISANGGFIFSGFLPFTSSYDVTVLAQPSGQSCSVSGGDNGDGTGSVRAGNDSSISVSCSYAAYTVGGTISGLTGTVVLQNNEGDDYSSSSNGSFVFATSVLHKGGYSVKVLSQPFGQTCNAYFGSGTINAANVTGVTVICANNGSTYTIGGSVTGLSGTVILQNNGGDDLSVNANGNFTFLTPLVDTSPYAVTVLTNPAGQSCIVSNDSGILAGGNVSDIIVVCSDNLYTAGGTVSGLSGTLVLQNNGGDDRNIVTDGSFTFNPQGDGSGYLVSIISDPAGQTCTFDIPANASGTIASASVGNIDITCVNDLFTVGGEITGLSGTVVLQNNLGDNLSRSVNGAFVFATSLAHNGLYDVTVFANPSGQSCTVSGGDDATGGGTVSGTNVNSITVTCVNNTYTVGGTISGLSGSITLQNNGADDYTTGVDGGYTFSTPVLSGSGYNVTVSAQPAGQTCTVSNGSGVVGTANIGNADIACSVTDYTISGTLVGLTSGTLILALDKDNDATSDETINLTANGGFNFVATVIDGDTFVVTVDTQPGGGQTCAVTNGTGTPATDVADIVVDCNGPAGTTYSVGGNLSNLNGTITLTNISNGDSVSVLSDGTATTYLMPIDLADTDPYDINITDPAGQTCSFDAANDSGSISGADVTNINITCSDNPYTVGVTLVGYDSGSVVLQNNGGDDLTFVASGFQNFSPGVSYVHGDSYLVTIFSKPGDQNCTVYNNSGTIDGGNIANVLVVCDDPAEVIVTFSGTVSVHEDASAPGASFTMQLSVEPAADVTVDLTTEAGFTDEADFSSVQFGATDAATVTFKPTATCTAGVNCWDQPLLVTILGENDSVHDGNQSFSIQTGAAVSTDPLFSGFDPADITVLNVDDDMGGIAINTGDGLIVTEGGTSDSFSVVLNAEPLSSVTISIITSGDMGEVIVAPASLTFTTGNWNTPQDVTVTGQDDVLGDGFQTTTIDLGLVTTGDGGNYPVGMDPGDVTVFTVDDEPEVPGLTVVADGTVTVTEGLRTYSIWTVLASPPTDNVTVPFAAIGGNSAEINVTTASPLTFTPADWNIPQKVEIEAVNDTAMDGDLGLQVEFGDISSPTDTGYDALTTVIQDVIAADNDRYVFTTTTWFNAVFSAGTGATPIDRADFICNDVTYGYPNDGTTYHAMLAHSTLRLPYPNQISWVFKPNATYYRYEDNNEVLTTNSLGVFDFSTGPLVNSFSTIASNYYWTGMYYDFTLYTAGTCLDWSSINPSDDGVVGATNSQTSLSVSGAVAACNNSYYILCVQQ